MMIATKWSTPEPIASQDTPTATPADFIPFVKAVGRGEKLKRDLSYEESYAALHQIVQRTASDAQIGAFLIAQRVKGESVDEIRGFTDCMRDHFIEQISPCVEGLLDLAVPYDGKAKTAQLAPAVAFVLAAAGVPVVMHGDENVPTKSGIGPGTVLQALGVPADLPPGRVERMIEACGFGYLSAARYAPRWHNLLPIRHEFGLRTVLNTVEKLFNPANAPYQVSGFFHGNYIERLRSTQTGQVASWIVQGEEGSIEMAAGRKTHIFATEADADIYVDPAAPGLGEREKLWLPPELHKHVALNEAVLAASTGSTLAQVALDQVALTAGVILKLLGKTPSVVAGVDEVRTLLTSGAAYRRLQEVRLWTGQT